jgi:hypothetical protein
MKLRMRLNMMTTLSWILVAGPGFAETNYNFQFQKAAPQPASVSASENAATPALPTTIEASVIPQPAVTPAPAPAVQTSLPVAQESKNRNTSISFGIGRFAADNTGVHTNNGGDFGGYALGASYMATTYLGVTGSLIFGKARIEQFEFDEWSGNSSSYMEVVDRNIYKMGLLFKPAPTLEYFDFGLMGGMWSDSEGTSKDLVYLGAKLGFKLNPFSTASLEIAKPFGQPGKDKTSYTAMLAWNF